MKNTLIAVGVFAALLAVYFATRETGDVHVGVAKLELPKLDPAKVTMVELAGAETLTLKKDGAGWSVADASKAFHPADESHVSAMLEGFKDLKAETLVTEKPEKHAELEVDDAKGLTLTATSEGAAPLTIVFGKAGKQGGAYLRAPKTNQVFLTNSRLPQDARHQAVWWRKRSIGPMRADQLASITVKQADGAAFTVEAKPDNTWALSTPPPAGYRFDATAALHLAGAVASLWATDFIDAAPATDPFAAPHVTVEAKGKDGKTAMVHLGAAVEKGTAVRFDGDPQLYVVAADQAKDVSKPLAELADTTLLAFDPAKAKQLVYSTGAKKTVVAKDGATWKVVEPKTLPAGTDFDPNQVTTELNRLLRLRGEAPAEVKGKAATTVEIAFDGAPVQKLEVGAGWAKGTADARAYTLGATDLAKLEKPLDLFKRPPAPPAGPPQQLRLEDLPPDIRAKIEAQLKQQK
jgi:hypothetical protein